MYITEKGKEYYPHKELYKMHYYTIIDFNEVDIIQLLTNEALDMM